MRVDLCLNPRQFKWAEVEALTPQLSDLLRRHAARAAYVFGSVRHDEANRLSDLDIAVLPPMALDDWLTYHGDLYDALSHLMHADNIDVVLLDRAPLALQAQVVGEGYRLFESADSVAFEAAVLVRYSDLAGREQKTGMPYGRMAR